MAVASVKGPIVLPLVKPHLDSIAKKLIVSCTLGKKKAKTKNQSFQGAIFLVFFFFYYVSVD